MDGIKFLILSLMIIFIAFASASPKTEVCNAINLTNSTDCTSWWENTTLPSYFENFSNYTLITVDYHTHIDEHEYRNYSYYNCTSCNCSFDQTVIYRNASPSDVYLTKSDFESQRFTADLGLYATVENLNKSIEDKIDKASVKVPLGWKITIIICLVLSAFAVLMIWNSMREE